MKGDSDSQSTDYEGFRVGDVKLLKKARAARKPPAGGKWTREEDQRLKEIVEIHGAKNWKKISELLGRTRADTQCLHRYNKVLRPGIHKGTWTREEDDLVRKMVAEIGLANVKWSSVAEKLPGRLGKQCRERWLNHLDPSIKKGNWTLSETRILYEAQRQFGNRWCELAKILPGRGENAVKNRFHSSFMRKWLKDNNLEPGNGQPAEEITPENAGVILSGFTTRLITLGIEIEPAQIKVLNTLFAAIGNGDGEEREDEEVEEQTSKYRHKRRKVAPLLPLAVRNVSVNEEGDDDEFYHSHGDSSDEEHDAGYREDNGGFYDENGGDESNSFGVTPTAAEGSERVMFRSVSDFVAFHSGGFNSIPSLDVRRKAAAGVSEDGPLSARTATALSSFCKTTGVASSNATSLSAGGAVSNATTRGGGVPRSGRGGSTMSIPAHLRPPSIITSSLQGHDQTAVELVEMLHHLKSTPSPKDALHHFSFPAQVGGGGLNGKKGDKVPMSAAGLNPHPDNLSRPPAESEVITPTDRALHKLRLALSRANRSSSTGATEAEVPLQLLPYFNYLNDTAQRSILRQVIDLFQRTSYTPRYTAMVSTPKVQWRQVLNLLSGGVASSTATATDIDAVGLANFLASPRGLQLQVAFDPNVFDRDELNSFEHFDPGGSEQLRGTLSLSAVSTSPSWGKPMSKATAPISAVSSSAAADAAAMPPPQDVLKSTRNFPTSDETAIESAVMVAFQIATNSASADRLLRILLSTTNEPISTSHSKGRSSLSALPLPAKNAVSSTSTNTKSASASSSVSRRRR